MYRGKVVAKCCGCYWAALCAAHKDGLCVPCQEGEEPEGGEEEELVEDPNGVSIDQCAQCLLPAGTTTGHFLLSGWGGGREVVAPLTNEEEVGGVAGPRDQCALGWSLVRPSMSLRHMHHCMSMNALEPGLLGLEAAKASDIDDFV